METKIEKPRCPKCLSDQVYYRRKTKDYACKKCGNTWSEKLTRETNVSEELRKAYGKILDKAGV